MLLGYSQGNYRWHRLVSHYTVGSGFDGGKSKLHHADWAKLQLAEPVSGQVSPLRLASARPPSGTEITLAGYNQDRAQILMADVGCRVTGAAMMAGELFIVDDCQATRGTSGGPLLMRQGPSCVVVGISVAVANNVNIGLLDNRTCEMTDRDAIAFRANQ